MPHVSVGKIKIGTVSCAAELALQRLSVFPNTVQPAGYEAVAPLHDCLAFQPVYLETVSHIAPRPVCFETVCVPGLIAAVEAQFNNSPPNKLLCPAPHYRQFLVLFHLRIVLLRRLHLKGLFVLFHPLL